MEPKTANEDAPLRPDGERPRQGGRLGPVALDDRFLAPPDLSGAAGFAEGRQRVEYGRQVARDLAEGNPFLDEKRLDELLWGCLRETALDGLLIGTRDGLTVAQAAREEASEILPVIGSLVEDTASRAEREGIVRAMDEMVLRGEDGELVVVRYFPGTERRFFLLAHARCRCAYRRGTNRIVRECGPMLAAYAGM